MRWWLQPLRYLKLARILKLSHFASTVSSVCDWVGLEPRMARLLMLALNILGLIHLGGCATWLVKVDCLLESSRCCYELLAVG